MASPHTPGPWKVHVGTNSKGQQQPPRVIGVEGRGPIAMLGINLDGSREANASLIAAAPDMLAALQQMARSFAAAGSDGIFSIEAKMIRAAIAKAEGRS